MAKCDVGVLEAPCRSDEAAKSTASPVFSARLVLPGFGYSC